MILCGSNLRLHLLVIGRVFAVIGGLVWRHSSHHEISEKSKCLIKQISRICGICGQKPAGLHASMAMRQDQATFMVGSQLAADQT